MTTTVPFDFIVGEARLSAGDYIVTEMSQDGMVSIASKDRERTAFVLTVRATFDRDQGREILLTPEVMERELQRAVLEEKR